MGQLTKRSGVLSYVFLIFLTLLVFAASIFLGFKLVGGGQKDVHLRSNLLRFSEPPLVTPTIGMSQSVTVEIFSELENLSVAGVDEAVLAQWWEIIGVNNQALPLKELGGYNWHAPTHLKIVFKDIAPEHRETGVKS